MMTTLTVPEVAADLRMSERFVRRQLVAKNLRGVKMGNRWRVTPEALAEFKGASKRGAVHKPLSTRGRAS